MFTKAKPIWLQGLEKEMNIQALFTAAFVGTEKALLKITGATAFRVYINGTLFHYGPARTAAGYARVDVVEIPREILSEKNIVKIEAVNYYCNSYAFIRQAGCIQAEIERDGEILAATGFDFAAYRVNARKQKVMRYSFQRQFSEIWDTAVADEPHEIGFPDVNLKYLDRRAPLPYLGETKLDAINQIGSFEHTSEKINAPRIANIINDISPKQLGFTSDEIAEKPFYDFCHIKYTFAEELKPFGSTVRSGKYAFFDFKRNLAGMMKLKFKAAKKSKLIIAFDEKLFDGKFPVDVWQCVNTVQLTAEGECDFTTFEVYGFRYAAVFVIEGEITLNGFSAIEYKNPITNAPTLHCDDPAVLNIYTAAVETARQNTVDLFMDCPTRERAGWLNDSYFSAQAEYAFTGKTAVEDAYIENCLLHSCPDIPEGMLPMCYPSDHFNGNFIPQCAMWFIAELEQYTVRNPKFDIAKAKSVADGILKFFAQYENEYGLLENLPGWNFIEWSKANDWVSGVNFPTNMMYAETLCIIGRLYGDATLFEKAQKIRDAIIKLSYNGTFFRDQAERDENGKLVVHPDRITEVCQYYAFLFKTATPSTFPALYNLLLTDFYPNTDKWSDIVKVDAIMGMYMRLELLHGWGEDKKVVCEIKDFFGHMAEYTGTLWELKSMNFSLNHGIAAYVGALLLEIYNK